MGNFIIDGAAVLPPVKSDETPATGAPTEWAAGDANKDRSALLDLRTEAISEKSARIAGDALNLQNLNSAVADAEAARDAAFVNANVYDSTAAGIAATTNGQQFQVVEGGEIVRYRNDSGTATKVASYPAAGFWLFKGIATATTNPTLTKNDYYLAVTPGTYTNFDGIIVGNEEVFLYCNGANWYKIEVSKFFTQPLQLGEIKTGYISMVITSGTGPTATWGVRVFPGTAIEVEIPKQSGGDRVSTITPTPGIQDLGITKDGGYNAGCILYCDYSGVFGITTANGIIPDGNYVAIAYIPSNNYYQTGFQLAAFIPTNHMYSQNGGGQIIPSKFVNVDSVNIKEFGAYADGITDDYSSLNFCYLVQLALGKPVEVYIPDGIYLLSDSDTGYSALQTSQSLRGQSKAGTILLGGGGSNGGSVVNAKNLTLKNIKIRDYAYTDGTQAVFENVRFELEVGGDGVYYFYIGNKIGCSFTFKNCDFVYPSLYAGLWLNYAAYVLVDHCSFVGNAYHNLRLVEPTKGAGITLTDNVVKGGVTGLFLGSNRIVPIENVLIERNRLSNITEENISLDGFGNNAGLVPVICNGPITAASNDGDGYLVIKANMTFLGSPCPVSSRSDWTNFYFSFGEGSGLEGSYAKILDYDDVADTFTVNFRTNASKVNLAGDCGVQSGFFHCVIRDNIIEGSSTVNGAPISVYLNVFGNLITGNKIIGCHQGILICGGLMGVDLRCLAYGNIVSENTIIQSGQLPGGYDTLRFENLYNAAIPSYNNQCVGNIIVGGRINLQNQQNFIFSDNMVKDATISMKNMGNTLPPADGTQIGRRFMLITDDGSGIPTDISYWSCVLTGGVYSWVASP